MQALALPEAGTSGARGRPSNWTEEGEPSQRRRGKLPQEGEVLQMRRRPHLLTFRGHDRSHGSFEDLAHGSYNSSLPVGGGKKDALRADETDHESRSAQPI